MTSLILTNLLLSVQKIPCNYNLESEFVHDFLKVEFGAPQLTAFVCCRKSVIINFQHLLFKSNYKVVVHNTYIEEMPRYEPTTNNVFFLDLDCFNSVEVLNMANQAKMLGAPYKWLLLTRNIEIFNRIKSNLINYHLLVDTFIYLGLSLNESAYSLNEIFKFYNGGQIQNRQLAVWTKDHGFGHYKGTILARVRRDLMGTVIKTAVVIIYNETYNHLWDYRRKHIDSLTKPNFLLVNILLEYVNSTKDFTFFKTWGYKNKTGKLYDGMIGEMQKDLIELSSSSLFITKERIPDMDFLSLTVPSEIKFIFRQPPLSHVTNLFTLPFSTTVWISIIGLVLLSVLVTFVLKVSEYQRGVAKEKDEKPTVSDSVMVAIGAVCQQGTIYEPMSDPGKLIMFLIFFVLMFFYVAYSAYIVVLLQSSSSQIRTLQDLFDSKMEMGVHDIVYNRYYFETATESLRKKIFDERLRLKKNEGFISLEEGVRRLRQGFYAFHCELPPAYTLIGEQFLESEKCGLQTMQFVEAGQLWLPIKKGSAFREILKIGLQKCHEYGIQSRELNRLQDKKPKCLGTGNSYVSVGLTEAGPAFFILGLGLGITLILFIFEHIIYYMCVVRQ